jgi:hypothetical protein
MHEEMRSAYKIPEHFKGRDFSGDLRLIKMKARSVVESGRIPSRFWSFSNTSFFRVEE